MHGSSLGPSQACGGHLRGNYQSSTSVTRPANHRLHVPLTHRQPWNCRHRHGCGHAGLISSTADLRHGTPRIGSVDTGGMAALLAWSQDDALATAGAATSITKQQQQRVGGKVAIRECAAAGRSLVAVADCCSGDVLLSVPFHRLFMSEVRCRMSVHVFCRCVCVHASVRSCLCTCVRACVRACAYLCMPLLGCECGAVFPD